MRKFYFFLITFLALGFSLNAQEITVTGIVTSAEDGWGLPGVTIQVKGTTRGEVTGIDGDYTIKVNSNDVLQFSYVGYQSQEIPVDGKTKMNDVVIREKIKDAAEKLKKKIKLY